MSMDIVRFGRIFGFLKKFLNAGHAPSFLGLLNPIPYKDMKDPFFIKEGSRHSQYGISGGGSSPETRKRL